MTLNGTLTYPLINNKSKSPITGKTWDATANHHVEQKKLTRMLHPLSTQTEVHRQKKKDPGKNFPGL
ncbi:hypothetical protein [Chryseobacterium sp. R2A-55]|uniref:hypothetical protein n=1 Tax=Chryseobacterium sp. R2A-55 TaxID=2744445 RepID=UPI001F365985|nr:hypothetical protein [Chryseobacterium sp. R2A-55]